MEATQLAQHKLMIAMKAVKDPDRLQTACGALFASYLAVLATLRLEFARTTAFARIAAVDIVGAAKRRPSHALYVPRSTTAVGYGQRTDLTDVPERSPASAPTRSRALRRGATFIPLFRSARMLRIGTAPSTVQPASLQPPPHASRRA